MRSMGGLSHPIEPRLIHLLAAVSNHFGSRKVEIISGFRPYSPLQHTAHSNHNIGKAVDFRVARACRTRSCATTAARCATSGCGYYPNSTFVHLDVRDKSHLLDRLLASRRAAALQRAEPRRRRGDERRRRRGAPGAGRGDGRPEPSAAAVASGDRPERRRADADATDAGANGDPDAQSRSHARPRSRPSRARRRSLTASLPRGRAPATGRQRGSKRNARGFIGAAIANSVVASSVARGGVGGARAAKRSVGPRPAVERDRARASRRTSAWASGASLATSRAR